jgi:hypothetical protein
MVGNSSISRQTFYSSVFHMIVGKKKTRQSGGSRFELDSDSNGTVKQTSEMADKLGKNLEILCFERGMFSLELGSPYESLNSIFYHFFVNKA